MKPGKSVLNMLLSQDGQLRIRMIKMTLLPLWKQICSGMSYVPVKTLEQQDIQCLHPIRQLLMKNRTALVNQIRGMGLEYGIAIPESAHRIKQCLPEHLEDVENDLTLLSQQLFHALLNELSEQNHPIHGDIPYLGINSLTSHTYFRQFIRHMFGNDEMYF